MALANFFDKAALAAAQVLRGAERSVVTAALDAEPVGLAFDGAAARSPEGQATAELVVNLLARLYPRINLLPFGRKSEDLAGHLVHRARAINPEIEIAEGQGAARAWLVVGETSMDAAAPAFYIGSDGWVARLSAGAPVGSGRSGNPFGAGAAACLGAANLFRLTFREYLPNAATDDALELSLLTYEQSSSPGWNPNLGRVNLGESHLVGLGAIGSGALWALSRLERLEGTLHLVDAETVDLGNLQRYVLTEQHHVGVPKAVLAQEALAGTALNAVPHLVCWADYVTSRGNWRFERVAVATDSARSRWEVQAALPRWLVNAWTQPADLAISRHSFAGDDACLLCLYLPDQEQKSEDQLVAEALGLPESKVEVRRLLHTGEPVGEEWVRRIAEALSIPAEPLLPFADRPLREFYAEAICGGMVLRLSEAKAPATAADVPLAFQSALAGIMLAAELVAHAAELKQTPLPTVTRMNLLAPLGAYLSFPERKHLSGRCICQDPDYISAYRAKYELP